MPHALQGGTSTRPCHTASTLSQISAHTTSAASSRMQHSTQRIRQPACHSAPASRRARQAAAAPRATASAVHALHAAPLHTYHCFLRRSSSAGNSSAVGDGSVAAQPLRFSVPASIPGTSEAHSTAEVSAIVTVASAGPPRHAPAHRCLPQGQAL